MTAPDDPAPADPFRSDPFLTVAGGRPDDPGGDGSRFRVLRPHARGNLGQVYVAHDAELHREVALKEIQPEHAHLPESRRRFLVEARVTGGLEHPGVVPVYSVGTHADGRPYYAMRFIRGHSLLEAIDDLHEGMRAGSLGGEEWSLRLRRLLRSIIVACQTIGYAHTRGVMHRDIKPHNIMLGRHGETVVVDWGLAKAPGVDEPSAQTTAVAESWLRLASREAGELTAIGSLIGTPAYMSPEQAGGSTSLVGPASDIYSLGATLYHLLAGQPAFRSGNVAELLQDVQAGRYPPLHQIQPLVAPGLEAIAAKAMAKAPEDRYATATALAEDIEYWLADQPFAAYRETPTERIFRWVRRHRAWAVAGFSAAVATALISLVAVKLVDDQRRVAHRLAGEKTALADAERNARELATTGVRRARAGELAANSRAIRRTQPELGVLLAVEGIRTTARHGLQTVPAAEESLREALMEVGGVPFHPPEPVLAVSAAGRWLVCASQFFDIDALAPGETGREHGVPAIAAVCSDDESRLALMAADGSVTVIDPDDSVRTPLVIAPAGGPVVAEQVSLRLSPNGRWLFVAAGGPGRLHDLHAPANPESPLSGSVVGGQAATVVFSPDSSRLAIQAPAPSTPDRRIEEVEPTGTGDAGVVHVWSLGDGRIEPTALPGDRDHRPLVFSPDGRELVTRDGQGDSRVRIWNLAEPGAGHLVAVVPGETTALFQPRSGRLVLTEQAGALKGWRLLSRDAAGAWNEEHVMEMHSAEPSCAIACSESWFVASFTKAEIYAWNLAQEAVGRTHGDLPNCILRGHRHLASTLAFSRDGRRLVSVARGSTQVWDFSLPHPEVINQTLAARPGTLLARPDAPAGGATGERVMSPDGHWLAIDGESPVIHVLDLTIDDPMRFPIELVGHEGKAVFHAFSRDSRWLATGGVDHTICIWDLTQLPKGGGAFRRDVQPTVRFATEGLDPACIRFGAEPGQIWIAGPVGDDGAIVLWEWSPSRPDAATRRAQVNGIAVKPRLAFSLTNDALSVTLADGTVERHRLHKGVPAGGPEPVPAGMAAVRPASTWTGRGAGPYAQSPDGRWRTNVAASGDIELIGIDADGREATTRLLHDREATFQCAAFSGDSTLLATGFSDGGLQVWKLRSDDISRSGVTLRGHANPVEFIEFDRSDRWLVSSSRSSLRLWEMDVDRLIALARLAVGRTLTDDERSQFGIELPNHEHGPMPSADTGSDPP